MRIYVLLNILVNSMWGKEISTCDGELCLKVMLFLDHCCPSPERSPAMGWFYLGTPRGSRTPCCVVELYWGKPNTCYKLGQCKCWQPELELCDELLQACEIAGTMHRGAHTESGCLEHTASPSCWLLQWFRDWGRINVMHLCGHTAILPGH